MRCITSIVPLLAAMMLSQVHAQGTFNKTLSLQGVSFHVTSTNSAAENTLRITPSGVARAPRTIEQNVDGVVIGAEIADLDGNGVPEIYVFIQSAGSGSYGLFMGHAVNPEGSISPITMQELTEDPNASAGYMGHDRFSVTQNRLVRQFPIYRAGDSNATPSGGMRQLQYQLLRRSNDWKLQLLPQETQETR